MGEGYKIGSRAYFKAYLTIQANSNIKVTAKSDRAAYEGTTDANGVITFQIKKKGEYKITSADNTSGVTIGALKSGQTYDADITVVSALTAFSVDTWATNTACCYWTKPGTNCTGIIVRRNTGSYPTLSTGTKVTEGNGSSLKLSTSSTVTGVTDGSLTAGTTYYYRAWAYFTINGKTYYSSPIGKTYKAVSVVNTTEKKTGAGTFTVPAGWRKMIICCIGGGGGAGSGNHEGYSNTSYGETESVGGSGGSGYMTQTTIDVIPGEVYNHVIGAGGKTGYFKNSNDKSTSYGTYSPYSSDPVAGTAGGQTYVTKSGSSTKIASANGGSPGGNATSGSKGYESSPSGGSGGSGGGGGVRARTSSYTTTSGSGGRNGGNGTAGVYNGSNVSSGGTGDGKTKTFNNIEHAGGGAGGRSRWGKTSGDDKYGTAGSCGAGANVGAQADANSGAGGGASSGGYSGARDSGGSGVVYYKCAA